MKRQTELLNKRNLWYRQPYIKMQLINSMKDREVIFMHRFDNWKCIRGIYIRQRYDLDKAFEDFYFDQKNYNIYISLAKYKKIPEFTKDLTKRSNSTFLWLREQARKEIFCYDLLLDFDCKDKKNYFKMLKQVLKTLIVLDSNLISYWFYPSGDNIHIVLEGKQFPNINLDCIKEFLLKFKDRLNLSMLDTIGIGALTKIRKCEYSLVNDRVVLPIKNNDFQDFINNFNYENYDSNKIIKKFTLNKRGLCKHNEQTENTMKKRFDLFLIYNGWKW